MTRYCWFSHSSLSPDPFLIPGSRSSPSPDRGPPIPRFPAPNLFSGHLQPAHGVLPRHLLRVRRVADVVEGLRRVLSGRLGYGIYNISISFSYVCNWLRFSLCPERKEWITVFTQYRFCSPCVLSVRIRVTVFATYRLCSTYVCNWLRLQGAKSQSKSHENWPTWERNVSKEARFLLAIRYYDIVLILKR